MKHLWLIAVVAGLLIAMALFGILANGLWIECAARGSNNFTAIQILGMDLGSWRLNAFFGLLFAAAFGFAAPGFFRFARNSDGVFDLGRSFLLIFGLFAGSMIFFVGVWILITWE